MPEETITDGGEKPFTKKEAIAYLGIAMRTLEYAMQDRTIAFEKHGTKVVFRKEHLDDYRAKAEIKSKDELCKQALKLTDPSTDVLPLQEPKTLHPHDARDLIQEFTSDANAERRLTKEAARDILVKIGNYSGERADEILATHQEMALDSFQQLGNKSPERALARMDWSFAVALCYLDFLRTLEYWEPFAEDEDVLIHLRTPFDPLIACPERMLPCLRTIPDAEFSKVMQETQAFFEVDYQAERKGFMARLSLSNATDATKSSETPLNSETAKERLWKEHCFEKHLCGGDSHFSNGLVPVEVVLRRAPESVNRAPFSFAGPVTQDALRKVLLSNFSVIDAANVLLGQSISLAGIAKIRWLRIAG